MKKIFTLCIMLAFTVAASAQKFHITDSGNVWRIEGNDNDGKQWGMYQTTYGDTLVNNLHYKFISTSQYTPCLPCQYGVTSGPVASRLIREDTMQGKVYLCCDLTHVSTDSSDLLLYDYKANLGDSVNGLSKGYVSGIDSVLYQGAHYKVITVTYLSGGSCRFSYVEGIGFPMSPFGYSYVMSCFEGGATLKCFSTIQGHIPISFNYYNWLGSFSYSNGCTSGITNMRNLEAPIVFPNPIMNELNLEHAPVGGNLKIMDLTGRIMEAMPIEAENMQIATPTLPSGAYYLIISLADGTQKISKLIKL